MPGLLQDKRKALVMVLAVALVPLLWLCAVAPPDPYYRGRRLSDYLLDLDGARLRIAVGTITIPTTIGKSLAEERNLRVFVAETAVKELGPTTIPLLTSWLESDSTIRARLRKLASAPHSRVRWL